MSHAYDAKLIQVRVDERIARLAARQHGVFSRAQAKAAGATRGVVEHRLRTRRWERASASVLKLSGTPTTWRQALMTAVLAWGAGVAISHRAAAALWGLAGFRSRVVELTVPRGRQRVARGRVHRSALPRGDATVIDGIPVTTPARNLFDLAAICPRRVVGEALDDAVTRGLVTIVELQSRLDQAPRQGQPGTAAMRRLLAERDALGGVPETVMESRLLEVLLAGGLPMPVPQYEIFNVGRQVAVPDFAYPDLKVAIEADGYGAHSKRDRWERDRVRDARLTLLGWRVLRFSWSDIERRPRWIAKTVHAALAMPPIPV